MHFGLIAVDHTDARHWMERHDFHLGIVVITPRSPHGARGYRFGAVYATDAAREHPDYEELRRDAIPAVIAAPIPVVVPAPETP